MNKDTITILDCINRIPKLVNEIIDDYPNKFLCLNKLKKKIKKIKFIASGSSYNATLLAKFLIEKFSKIDVEVVYPNLFNKFSEKYFDDTLYVFVSQTGKTKLVYDNLVQVKKYTSNTLAMTESENTDLAKYANYNIEIGCGYEEFVYRTIGYSTTVVSCCLLGIYLSEEKVDIKEFQKVSERLEDITQSTIQWYENNKIDIIDKEIILFTGADSLYPISIEADIKFMEMVPIMTKTYELEEFIHGPQNAFNVNQLFFVLSKKGVDDEKTIQIAKFLKNEIGSCYIVGDLILEDKDYFIDIDEKLFYQLKYICFFQTVSYMLAIDKGRDFSKKINSSINEYIKKTL